MADAFEAVGLSYASYVIYFCAFFGITAACFTNLLVSSNLFHCKFMTVFLIWQCNPKCLQAQAEDGLLPKIFAKVSPTTHVPVAGAWLCFLFLAIPTFMLDLEAITKVISCGNLLTYSFVTACGVALRFRERET